MNYHPKWIFEIIPASRNLGCFAIAIRDLIYIDFYKLSSGFGIFVRRGYWTKHFRLSI